MHRRLNYLLYLLICISLSHISPPSIYGQIGLYDDEFSDPASLENWININAYEGWSNTQLENYNIGDSVSGSLFMLPLTESWFAEYKGAYLFKKIAGDFILTSFVRATGRDGISLPQTSFSLAGIMIRTPIEYPSQNPETVWVANQQNYIFMSIGRANAGNYAFEIKNTCGSRSCLNIVSYPNNQVQIRMIRQGNHVIVMSKSGVDPWQIQRRYDRLSIMNGDIGSCDGLCDEPFPDTVQIGFVAYTDWEKVSTFSTADHNRYTLHPDSLPIADPSPMVPFLPDMRASFDFVRFDSLHIPDTVAHINGLSNGHVLELYGYDSEPNCPDTLNVSILPVSDRYVRAMSHQNLHSQITIATGTTLKLSSPDINLLPGFEIEEGAIMEANQETCNEP